MDRRHRARPDVDAHWLVYADWLLERGDIRGELITLGLAPASDDRRQRIYELERREDELLSPRLLAQAHYWCFTWRRGFIIGAHLVGANDDRPSVEAIDALFADPHADLLGGINISSHDDDVIAAAVCAADRRWLRTVRLSGSVRRLDGLAATTPQLEQLFLDPGDGLGLRALAHPTLRMLEVATACPAIEDARVDLPNLEKLGIGRIDPLFAPTSILHQPPPRLRDLRFKYHAAPFGPLAGAAALPQLRTLALETGARQVDELCRLAPAFAHLEQLRVSFIPLSGDDHPRDPASIARLRERIAAALPSTRLELDTRWLRADTGG